VPRAACGGLRQRPAHPPLRHPFRAARRKDAAGRKDAPGRNDDGAAYAAPSQPPRRAGRTAPRPTPDRADLRPTSSRGSRGCCVSPSCGSA
jgi:hypothetical protein